jgi:hypothetical protein
MKDLRPSMDKHGRVFFPHADIYPSPLMDHYEVVHDKNRALHFAIAYLEADRVFSILSAMSKDEYLNYKRNADMHALHRLDNNGHLALIDCPYTNMHRCFETFDRFDYIESMLKQME